MASGVARINPTPPASPPAMPVPPQPPAMQAPPLPSPLTVGFQDGLLSIAADRASLAEVLYQIQVQTGAEIDVPSGAELEKVSATLGPALASDVLAQLLDGSPYNLIVLGSFEDSIDRVILTPKVPGILKVSQMTPATPGSGVDPGQPPGQPEMKTPLPDQLPPPD